MHHHAVADFVTFGVGYRNSIFDSGKLVLFSHCLSSDGAFLLFSCAVWLHCRSVRLHRFVHTPEWNTAKARLMKEVEIVQSGLSIVVKL